MPRSSAARIDQLVERVEALEGEVRELRETLTPREKLRRVVDRIRQKTKHLSQRELDKAVESALREVRSGRRRGS
jgi:F0F1-type ATP synthase membrane subunit b/b'